MISPLEIRCEGGHRCLWLSGKGMKEWVGQVGGGGELVPIRICALWCPYPLDPRSTIPWALDHATSLLRVHLCEWFCSVVCFFVNDFVPPFVSSQGSTSVWDTEHIGAAVFCHTGSIADTARQINRCQRGGPGVSQHGVCSGKGLSSVSLSLPSASTEHQVFSFF